MTNSNLAGTAQQQAFPVPQSAPIGTHGSHVSHVDSLATSPPPPSKQALRSWWGKFKKTNEGKHADNSGKRYTLRDCWNGWKLVEPCEISSKGLSSEFVGSAVASETRISSLIEGCTVCIDQVSTRQCRATDCLDLLNMNGIRQTLRLHALPAHGLLRCPLVPGACHASSTTLS